MPLRMASSRRMRFKLPRLTTMLGAPTSDRAPLGTSPKLLPFLLDRSMRGIGESQRFEHVKPVACQDQPAACVIPGAVSRLVDLCIKACTLEQQCGDGTSNPASNNQGFS